IKPDRNPLAAHQIHLAPVLGLCVSERVERGVRNHPEPSRIRISNYFCLGTYLGELLPFGEEVLDFYHAVTHLGDALGAAYGEGTPQYQARFATLREVLRDAPEGVDTVLGALSRLRTRYPRRQ